MRTSLLIFLGFAILVVALAAKPNKKGRDLDSSLTEGSQKDESESTDEGEADQKNRGKPKGKETSSPPPSKSKKAKFSETSADNPPSTRKPNKNPKSTPAKKPSKKALKKETDDIISEDLKDILKNNSGVEVEIPSIDELTTESDPIKLGKQIRKVKDTKKRNALIAQLKKAYISNDGTLPGTFYRAAYATLSNANGAAEAAEEYWNNHLEEATEKVQNAGKDIIGKANAGIGDVLGNAQKFAQIDPLGIALRRGESVLLTALSDSLKNLGKLTDFAYDATKNTSRLIRAGTFPVDYVPIASQFKNNIHDFIEEGADRGKYLTGSFADNGSAAFANAAKNAGRKADEKEELLRQFTSTRKI